MPESWHKQIQKKVETMNKSTNYVNNCGHYQPPRDSLGVPVGHLTQI